MVPRGGRAGVTAAALNQSPLWDIVFKTTLTQSMRLASGINMYYSNSTFCFIDIIDIIVPFVS